MIAIAIGDPETGDLPNGVSPIGDPPNGDHPKEISPSDHSPAYGDITNIDNPNGDPPAYGVGDPPAYGVGDPHNSQADNNANNMKEAVRETMEGSPVGFHAQSIVPDESKIDLLPIDVARSPGKASLSGGSGTERELGRVESSYSEAPGSESWALVPIKNHGASSPKRAIQTVHCASPNGFQVLQNIREEGEIDEENEDKKDDEEHGNYTNSLGETLASVEDEVPSAVAEPPSGSTFMKGSNQRV
ncbi:hypothetical protein YC2023_050732 [Brassica napus]